MSWPASPPWLLELQQRFGDLLRTPLDRSSGALQAVTSAYEPKLVDAVRPTSTLSAAEHLAVYHRQYWFRLFTVLQRLYPLTARLVGFWQFNELAARHLLEHAPRGFDLDTIGDGFVDSVTAQLPHAAAVLEAAQIDAAFQRVTRAPSGKALRLGAAEAARLASSYLVPSRSAALLRERWPLCQLRVGMMEEQDSATVTLGAQLPAARYWLLARHESKLGLVALEQAEGELLTLLRQYPVAQALGLLEAAVPEAERAQLPERAQAWLARSVQLGVWTGLADVPESG